MSRDYGRVRTLFWEDEKVRDLSPTVKFVAIYLLTSPHTNAIGCFRLPGAYACHDTGMAAGDLDNALGDLSKAGIAKKVGGSFIWIPNYIRHNPPENPNVWRKCLKELQALPKSIPCLQAIAQELAEVARDQRMKNLQSDEKTALEPYLNGIDTVSKGISPNLTEPDLSEPSILRIDSAPPAAAPPKPKTKSKRSLPEGFPFQEDLDWATNYWLRKGRADLCDAMTEEIEKFRDHHAGKSTTSAEWPGNWRTWARNAMNFSRRQNGNSHGKQSAHATFIAAGPGAVDLLFGPEREVGQGEGGIVINGS